MVRRQGEQRALRRLLLLRKAYNQNREDLQRARDEIRQVYEAMEAVRENAGSGGAELQEVASEVKVLHALIEQLYSGDGSDEVDRAATAEDDGRVEPSLLPDRVPAAAGRDRVLDTVREALRQNRVELYLQPVVSLPQRRRRFYECFSRIHAAEGEIIAPERYLDAAKHANLIAAIDNMLLFRCVQLIRKLQQHNYTTAFFCNVSPNTFADRRFFQDFIQYLESCPDLAPSLVFELSQDELAEQADDAQLDLARLRAAGYRFCMDKISDLSFDADGLADRGFQFVKIEAAALLDRASNDDAANEVRLLKQALDRAGVDLVVEGVETEQMLVELLDFNIDYGQGYLFGEPRLSKEPPPNPLQIA